MIDCKSVHLRWRISVRLQLIIFFFSFSVNYAEQTAHAAQSTTISALTSEGNEYSANGGFNEAEQTTELSRKDEDEAEGQDGDDTVTSEQTELTKADKGEAITAQVVKVKPASVSLRADAKIGA